MINLSKGVTCLTISKLILLNTGIYMYVSIHIYCYMSGYVCIHISIYLFGDVYIHISMYLWLCMYPCIFVSNYICIYLVMFASHYPRMYISGYVRNISHHLKTFYKIRYRIRPPYHQGDIFMRTSELWSRTFKTGMLLSSCCICLLCLVPRNR